MSLTLEPTHPRSISLNDLLEFVEGKKDGFGVSTLFRHTSSGKASYVDINSATRPSPPARNRRVVLSLITSGAILVSLFVVPMTYNVYTRQHELRTSVEASASADASARASTTQAVPDGTKICDLLDATDLERRTSLQIISYAIGRSGDRPIPTQSCYIYFAQPDKQVADMIDIFYVAPEDPGLSLVEDRQRAVADSAIEALTLNGLSGEAVSYMFSGNEVITWRSPRGGNLHIRFSSDQSSYDARDPDGAHNLLIHILYEVAPIIDDVASGPAQQLTYYPPRETATPTP